MANRLGGDPQVKEWMKEHKEEVAKVQAKYDELKKLTTEQLLEMASEGVVAKVRERLISGIIAVK